MRARGQDQEHHQPPLPSASGQPLEPRGPGGGGVSASSAVMMMSPPSASSRFAGPGQLTQAIQLSSDFLTSGSSAPRAVRSGRAYNEHSVRLDVEGDREALHDGGIAFPVAPALQPEAGPPRPAGHQSPRPGAARAEAGALALIGGGVGLEPLGIEGIDGPRVAGGGFSGSRTETVSPTFTATARPLSSRVSATSAIAVPRSPTGAIRPSRRMTRRRSRC